jgi:hypothetical protein
VSVPLVLLTVPEPGPETALTQDHRSIVPYDPAGTLMSVRW